MIKLLLITSVVAMAPRASRPKKIRGVPEHKWSFDILTKWKKEGEHAQIVATDARGEVGWFEVLRSRGGNVLHAPLKNEPVVERAYGTNVLVEPCVEINQCVRCTRQFFTKSFLGDDAAVLASLSGEESASSRHRAGLASMAWRTTR